MAAFLIDEDMSRSTAHVLREAGYTVEDVRDIGLRGHSDADVFAYAQDHALTAEIRPRAEMNEQPIEDESFVIVGDLLRELVAPASVRAALFEVAAGIPGVELLGTVEDPAGRSGTAVAYTHDGIRSELIFDPRTSMLLAERDTVAQTVGSLPFPVGTMIGYATCLEAGIVPSTSATP